MAAVNTLPPKRWLKPPVVRMAVFGLLMLYAVIALTASMQKGSSFDEDEELAVGYGQWVDHDYRMEGANGDFVKRWATLPYLFTHPNYPDKEDPFWLGAQPYTLGFRFFFQSGNPPEMLLLQGRIMMVLLGMATGLLVFLCAREIFGAVDGLLSLALFVFSPHMLAFGSMVSTEMSVCLTLLGSTWCIWRLLHRVTLKWLGASLLFLGLLFLSKLSGLVIFPITAALIAIKLVVGRPLEWQVGKPRLIRSRRAQLGVILGLILLHGACAWSMIWLNYEERYYASPEPANTRVESWRNEIKDPVDPSVYAVLTWCRQTHFLPQGFLRGVQRLLETNEQRESFMDGQWKQGGWSMFFPYTLWAKTSPALLVMFCAGLAGWAWMRHLHRMSESSPAPPLYESVPYLTLIAVYIGVAMSQQVDIGHRHVLPIYPALYILGGGGVSIVWAMRKKWMQTAIIGLMFWLMVESFMLYPNYLAYFSPMVGGPAQGYQRLVDSSLDWGMDLPSLKRWLDQHNPGNREPFYLAYFGTDIPEYYGIHNQRLPGFPDWQPRTNYPLVPGIYAISATLYQSVYIPFFGPWTDDYERKYQACLSVFNIYRRASADPTSLAELLAQYPQAYWQAKYQDYDQLRFARLCAWLRHNKKPDDEVSYTILVWRLSAAEINAALTCPAVELEEPARGG